MKIQHPTVITQLDINGASSGTVTIQGATNAGTYTLTLPTDDGTPSQFLQTDGSGVLTWASGAAGANTALSNLASVAINTTLIPGANDGAALGVSGTAFSDLFLASGGVINWSAGNVALTHSTGILTQTAGELRITSANVGTNADSVPTLSSTSTMTNKSLTSPAITTGTYTGDQVLNENATIQLDPALSADGKYTGITIVGTAGATVSFGDLLYLASSGKWLKAKADVASTSGGVLLGFALGSSSDTNPVTLLLRGNIRADAAFPTFTVGAVEYISAATAGAITETQPSATDNAIRVVGFALTTDSIMFDPSPDYITHT